ncbi:MAG: GTPase Era, partial [Oscillospiraceae bacterium]|nr:GTPase Era [Oscillospiraceae bacterium]
ITGYDECVPISAKSGRGLSELKEILLNMMPEGPEYFPDDMITDQPVRNMCAEIIREQALTLLRYEIPYGIGVEIQKITKLSDKLTEIFANIYVEKDGHKRIVIGSKGSMLQKIGSQARLAIEELMETHVSLQLWVKVREDWRNRTDDLRTLGYTSE